MIYAVFCRMLPRNDEPPPLRMVHETFASEEEAQAHVDEIRRQNLPYRGWVVSFEDPRNEEQR